MRQDDGRQSEETVEALLEECGRLHGHVCPGQLLGVRMALLGCRSVGIAEPKGADRKKLIVWVEIDRCMADAVCAVTGVSLGRRTLKYVDYGKVAATFYNSLTDDAVRVVALDEARGMADSLYPEIVEKKSRQMRSYSEAEDRDLFKVERVKVRYEEKDRPGRPISRVVCQSCGEGVNDGREVVRAGAVLCRPCAEGAYFTAVK